jgi:hypothetical protein
MFPNTTYSEGVFKQVHNAAAAKDPLMKPLARTYGKDPSTGTIVDVGVAKPHTTSSYVPLINMSDPKTYASPDKNDIGCISKSLFNK